ncbi:hypothetical protein O6H91_06G084300 [Diphasiastrum complanatum]|uniref:Uncharacterized protein n=1 Tax=Diphasiastrum complanatum TaxID=34168 RepID=A0ACC2DG43_DIPCM|nr:hypothetical protein O6H91_06G084300 [Diphasiastrum complanatum]
MVARSGCEVVMPSHMEQEITAAVEEELAALVARYLEKRGLKRTLTRFLKEARLVNRLENSKEDLEEIYTSYMSGIKSASCKKKKAKQDLLEPSQKKAKLVTRTSSVDNQSVADKTDGKNGNEVDSVEGDRSALQTIAGKMKSLLAVNSDTVTQEASKLKKKSRKAKAPGIGKSGMVEVKSFDGQHSEGPPLVITQLDNGSEDCIRKSKQPEAIGVRAFQRVKLDEVTFADPRLQNNSYWAKDGAEMGWGAKAEEVLGQVKGRDFRHEKTKKKRGSYKGGAIDLHSRSIKFSYSDEE